MPHPTFSDSEDEGEIRFVAPRRAGDVVSAALRFAGTEARTLGLAVLAIVGPLVLAAAALRVIGGTGGGDTLASLADIGVNVLLTAVVLAYVRAYRAATLGAGEVADVWDETKTLLGPVAVATGAMLLAALALMIPIVLVVTGLLLASPVLAVGVGGVLVVALLLFAVPQLSLAIVAVGLDGLEPLAAFRRASALVRGDRSLVLRTVGLLFVAASLVLVCVGGGVAASLGADRMAEPGVGAALATALVSVVTLPVSVVLSVAFVVLYGSLVAGGDDDPLRDDVDAIARLGEQERPGDTLARLLDDDTEARS